MGDTSVVGFSALDGFALLAWVVAGLASMVDDVAGRLGPFVEDEDMHAPMATSGAMIEGWWVEKGSTRSTRVLACAESFVHEGIARRSAQSVSASRWVGAILLSPSEVCRDVVGMSV